MLQGKHLSSVQEFAVEMLLIKESKQRQDEQVDAFRLALITHDPRITPKLYPDAGIQEPDEADLMTNDEEIEWQFNPDTDKGQAAQVLTQMLANPNGKMRI